MHFLQKVQRHSIIVWASRNRPWQMHHVKYGSRSAFVAFFFFLSPFRSTLFNLRESSSVNFFARLDLVVVITKLIISPIIKWVRRWIFRTVAFKYLIWRVEPEKDENSELNDTNCTEFYYQNVIHKNPGLLTIEQLQNAMDRNDLFSLDMLCKLFERVGFELPQYVQPKLWQLK